LPALSLDRPVCGNQICQPTTATRRAAALSAISLILLLATASSASAAPAMPRPDHVLIVVMENKEPGEVLNSRQAPYLTALAKEGASFTNAHAETHPSQPNYIALFSGSKQGVTDNDCGHAIAQPNLGSVSLGGRRTPVRRSAADARHRRLR
jgi:acid phosphatase